MRRRVRNWAGNQRCRPAAVEHPRSEEEIAGAVRAAAAAGRRVRVLGAGHSFTDAAMTDGTLLVLDRHQEVLAVDRERGRVTVQAGLPLWKLSRILDEHGLALPNLGDIAAQSVAGAVSTATHGTGRRLGNLSTFVEDLRLVLADGSVLECSAVREPEVFDAARVSLGALGVLSSVTLRCVPAFDLHAVEMPQRLDGLLEALDREIDGHDHFEFFWVPHTGWALTKRNDRTTAPRAPRPRWKAFRDDVLISNWAFGALCEIGRWRPESIPRLARALPRRGRVEYVDRSDRVFASPRLVRFVEMELAIPRTAAVEVVRRVRDFVKREDLRLSFPVEVRFVAADELPLSPAFGRETCYVAVHVYRGMPFERTFRGVERICADYGARPHWGKLHFHSAETLAPLYPAWERFQAVRARLDPEGRFSNSYLERVLGPRAGRVVGASPRR